MELSAVVGKYRYKLWIESQSIKYAWNCLAPIITNLWSCNFWVYSKFICILLSLRADEIRLWLAPVLIRIKLLSARRLYIALYRANCIKCSTAWNLQNRLGRSVDFMFDHTGAMYSISLLCVPINLICVPINLSRFMAKKIFNWGCKECLCHRIMHVF